MALRFENEAVYDLCITISRTPIRKTITTLNGIQDPQARGGSK